ncbi:glycosyltransferase [Fodinibius salsisoli]|uniref:Glycosyltransferase n=1 Tax=Fodinibius salsisoli TaxID=2820877 RepID=A0ABT3PTJ8_9BACT|nr:glycosyltransferase [Fodinibius salsisoli]MCW9709185.1 glycosyltransferase [Fodinibius salsisoli]
MEEPLVSIITPVFNAEEKIISFLDAVAHQDYPRDCYEIIIVDNGSTDQTREKIASYSGDVTLLQRTDLQNPYAARNKGLLHAQGDLMVLLDVNCTPTTQWLRSGINRLQDPTVDLVGGQVSFTYSEEETVGEWYDSLLFVDMEDLIQRGQSCAGGNLFFKRKVLDKIGSFPEKQRSGMDLYWTKKASNSGFNLVYDARAEVHYPARRLRPLLKKIFRVGTGQPKVWIENDMHPLKLVALIFYQLVPPGTKVLRDKIRRRGKPTMNKSFGRLWLIHYLQQIVLASGWAKGLIHYYRTKS